MSISVIQGVLRIPAAQDKIRQKGIEKPGFPENYTLIDVETTGLSPYRDRITEMGGLKVRHGEVVATFSELVKFPDSNKVPTFITKLMMKQLLKKKDYQFKKQLKSIVNLLAVIQLLAIT